MAARPFEADAALKADLRILFAELVASRDRLADLPALIPGDIERAEAALHEVRWFFLTPPPGRKTSLELPEATKELLLKASRNADIELFVLAVAVIAAKVRKNRTSDDQVRTLDQFADLLDELSFDDRLPRKAAIERLRLIRDAVDERIGVIRGQRIKPMVLDPPPEKYAERQRKAEKPDAFLKRVYGAHIRRGLTQADIRRADPAFYNVLHVWCIRNKRLVSRLVPAARRRRPRLT